LAKLAMTWSVARPDCDSWVSCIYILCCTSRLNLGPFWLLAAGWCPCGSCCGYGWPWL